MYTNHKCKGKAMFKKVGEMKHRKNRDFGIRRPYCFNRNVRGNTVTDVQIHPDAF